jgi:hypothetical protein
MQTITIYKENGIWIFDDASKNIEKEPFVGGFSELIDYVLKERGVWAGSHRGIDIEFSLEKNFDDQIEIKKVEDMGDDWALYEYKDMQGTLCPVTLQYLGKHPDCFFIRPIKKPFTIEFQITENKDNPLPFSL